MARPASFPPYAQGGSGKWKPARKAGEFDDCTTRDRHGRACPTGGRFGPSAPKGRAAETPSSGQEAAPPLRYGPSGDCVSSARHSAHHVLLFRDAAKQAAIAHQKDMEANGHRRAKQSSVAELLRSDREAVPRTIAAQSPRLDGFARRWHPRSSNGCHHRSIRLSQKALLRTPLRPSRQNAPLNHQRNFPPRRKFSQTFHRPHRAISRPSACENLDIEIFPFFCPKTAPRLPPSDLLHLAEPNALFSGAGEEMSRIIL